jgi:Ca-activated chloride channel family protein
MKQKSFEKSLREEAVPAPREAAREAARRAALAAFAEAHPAANETRTRGLFKGLSEKLRLSREPSHGRTTMAWNKRVWLGSAASICVAIMGSMLVWTTASRDPEVVSLEPAPRPVGDAQPGSQTGPDPQPRGTTSTDAQIPRDVTPHDETAGSRQETLREQQAPRVAQSAEPKKKEPAYASEPSAPAFVVRIESEPAPSILVDEGVDNAPAAMPAALPESQDAEQVIVTGSRGRVDRLLSARGTPIAGSADSRERTYRVPPAPPPAPEYTGRDRFEHFDVNPVKRVAEEPVSTFSADVDTASYSFVRRQLEAGLLPQKDAVRVEEMINYFDYAWPAAESREQPFQPTVIVGESPWGKGRKLVHIGIKGYELRASEQPDSNLVLLMDVSGSMSGPDRLPLAVQSMKLLLGSLKPTDTVAIVVYAGAAGMVLEPTSVSERATIERALDRLSAGGSTAGAEGIRLAYELAGRRFREGGVNRILLATDGDFNVGIDSTEELKGFVERQREKGIYLSVLGYGMGNYRDEMAQALAQNGNGVAAYIDSLDEARKVLVEQATGSLFTIARDVKLQVEFNPRTVSEYRLVGYETRALKREDFNNDAVDAGDVGAGHTVTAIYEIVPVGSGAEFIGGSRYAKEPEARGRGREGEYGFLKIRYKLPDENESKLIEQPIGLSMPAANARLARDVQFSTAVAGFAQLLRGGTYTGKLRYDDIIEQADAARGSDDHGRRAEFVKLVRKARTAK